MHVGSCEQKTSIHIMMFLQEDDDTESAWMCRYVLILGCPSRISSSPPVQLFLTVNSGDGQQLCSVTQGPSVFMSSWRSSETSPCAQQWPVLDFDITFRKSFVTTFVRLLSLNPYFKTENVKLWIKMLKILGKYYNIIL